MSSSCVITCKLYFFNLVWSDYFIHFSRCFFMSVMDAEDCHLICFRKILKTLLKLYFGDIICNCVCSK